MMSSDCSAAGHVSTPGVGGLRVLEDGSCQIGLGNASDRMEGIECHTIACSHLYQFEIAIKESSHRNESGHHSYN